MPGRDRDGFVAQPVSAVAIASTWLNALRLADERVCADQNAGYTTLIGFAVAGGHVIGAANGDSALWLAGADGHILDLTARQAKNPPIGSGGDAPTPFAAKLPKSWIVLAMSDGVWKGVGRERVAELPEAEPGASVPGRTSGRRATSMERRAGR